MHFPGHIQILSIGKSKQWGRDASISSLGCSKVVQCRSLKVKMWYTRICHSSIYSHTSEIYRSHQCGVKVSFTHLFSEDIYWTRRCAIRWRYQNEKEHGPCLLGSLGRRDRERKWCQPYWKPSWRTYEVPLFPPPNSESLERHQRDTCTAPCWLHQQWSQIAGCETRSVTYMSH